MIRFLSMALAVAALLAGMWAGLIRIGWALPPLQPVLPALHGPLMVSGFLGTLIGLERAVGTGKRWAYGGPSLTAAGAALALLGIPGWPAPLLITVGSAVTCAVLVTLVRLQSALFTAVIAGGGFAWLAGNLLWLLGRPIPEAVLWWIAFLVLTIAGERLELSRLLKLSHRVQMLFLTALAPIVLGAAIGPWHYGFAMRLAGLGMLAMALWLLRFDIARRRIKAGGQARFIAVALLSGYVWLGIAGLLALWFGGVMAGPHYDAILHSVFLGFVFAMIFAHAPIVFPAVLHVPMRYTPRFYSHLVLLHVSLAFRVAGDLFGWWEIRRWGGMLNVLVLLLFLLNTGLAVRQGRRAATASTRRNYAPNLPN